ncbi:MAG TPA: VWA domain-containing protein, partial [Bryobacteraceae bacterium]|nr:VWA domain-containing protein [Bryobacteraceae bacterium]
MTSQDAPVVFRSTSNLIPVPVVVRDNQGHTVGNLAVEDFQLFDNGKPQLISKFSVEKLGEEQIAAPAAANSAAQPPSTSSRPPSPSADDTPDHFVAYLFDDLHLSLQDLANTRDAALRQIDSSRNPKLRIAIYTTSGQQNLEFTADRDKIRAAVNAISVSNASTAKSAEQNSCPAVDYYTGDLIYNKDDVNALRLASVDAMFCLNLPMDPNQASDPALNASVRQCEGPHDSTQFCTAVEAAKRSARLAVQFGDRDTEAGLSVTRALIARMTSMPGKRNIVLISPGYLVLEDRRQEEMNLIERAIKASVVIGGLDARGLYTMTPGGGASEHIQNSTTLAQKTPFRTAESMTVTDVIADLAEGTGGTFYHGTNDFDEGMARVAATPEYVYVLGFSPENLKLDGKFHALKVTLKNHRDDVLQVRKGYYAASAAAGPESQASQQIEETFFSRDEIHDLPAVLQTQYFKGDNGDVTLSAVTKIDAKKLTFKKVNDRNTNDVTVVTGLFDSDGNYVSGQQKILQMRFLDRTLDTRLNSGLSVEQ